MGMSGIDGSRVAPPTALPQRIGSAVHPARPIPDYKPAAGNTPAAAPSSVARVASAGGSTNPAYAIGFLAQAIAQESLLLGARAPRSDHREPVELYRRTQDDTAAAPGPQISIDLKI